MQGLQACRAGVELGVSFLLVQSGNAACKCSDNHGIPVSFYHPVLGAQAWLS